ncbi:MAG: M14 family metallopeptidase [Bryobacteraceae bacterium]|nr:M14 family metallopeptidase [Bryobacteraceae bacterium]
MRRAAFLVTAAVLTALSAVAAAPDPSSFLGHPIGQDKSPVEWAQVTAYYRALEHGSDRVRVIEYGRSTEGRPMIAAIVSAPENLKRLDRFQEIQRRLSDPRITPEDEAGKLIAEGKTIVLITCSVHSTEVVSTLSSMEFAWRLASGATPKLKQVLDNVIVIIAPSINPDGVDIVAKWYKQTLGTPFEGTPPPELYQKYIGHDNNRDWYIFSQAETRAVVSKLHNVWHPQIVYDVHQMGSGAARMFVPPWMDPIDPNVDPVIAQEANMLGMGMATDLTAAGRKGVAVNAVYDFWTPGRHYQSYHGGMRILTESASARLFSPIEMKAGHLDANGPGYSPRVRSWNHLEPWPGGTWRVRDIMEDQLIAMESLCWQAAVRREDLLRNFYGINRRAVERREPYAFIVPAVQRDPSAARKLLETLDFGAIEIERASAPIASGDETWPAGSYVIRMQQPWSAWAKTLLERQDYPNLREYPGGPPKRPYDVTAQTLPMLMGVRVDSAGKPIEGALRRAREIAFQPERPAGTGVLSASDSDTWKRVTQAWKEGASVYRSSSTGDFRLSPAAGFELVKKPRVGLYRSFVPNMDEGWTRWIFEQFGWPYESAGNAAIRSGRLIEKFDAIVFPDQRADVIANGYLPGAMPDAYLGGLGVKGAEALRQFLADGGRLIFLNQSGGYAASQLGVKVRNTLEGQSNRDVYCPGSLLNVKSESADPALAGVPAEFAVWNESSPVWEPLEGTPARVLLRYASTRVLASGWLLGEWYYAGKPALLEVGVGKGKVYLFGMRPQYRAQSYLTLKLLFNVMAQ